MATSNEDIRDRFLQRQIRVLRTSAGLSRQMIATLDAAERDLREVIDRRTSTMVGDRIRFSVARTRRLQRLREAIRDLQRNVWKDIRRDARQSITTIGAMEFGAAAIAIESSLPVIVDLTLPTLDVIRAAITSKPFQGKVLNRWLAESETGDLGRIMDSVRIGLVQGDSSTEIVRRVVGTSALRNRDGTRQITRRGLQGIAQTAVSFITNEARDELFLANTDILPEKVFTATLDSRTTAICRSLDGRVFRVAQRDAPALPLHFNERSLYVPAVNGRRIGSRPATGASQRLLEGLRGRERRAAVERLTGQVPAETTYTEFLRRSTVDFQNEALGVTKARLFRRGGLSLDRFVNEAGRELTVRELIQLQPEAFRRAGLRNLLE